MDLPARISNSPSLAFFFLKVEACRRGSALRRNADATMSKRRATSRAHGRQDQQDCRCPSRADNDKGGSHRHPSMASRPLPALPAHASPMRPEHDLEPFTAPYYMSYPYAPQPYEEHPTTSLPVGTFLHKGFYDLLSMIPTPSPSRLLWKAPPAPPENVVAGPRYEDMAGNTGTRALPKKGRRVSKDMVSKPTGFVYVLFK